MKYNDSLDEYMKKRRKEFFEERFVLLQQKMGRLSKSDEIKLREKYSDLFLFEQLNRKPKNGKPKSKVRRKVRFDRDFL